MPSPSSTTNTCSGQIFRYGPTNLKKGHLDSKINCYVASKGDKQTNKQASEQASKQASKQVSKQASNVLSPLGTLNIKFILTKKFISIKKREVGRESERDGKKNFWLMLRTFTIFQVWSLSSFKSQIDVKSLSSTKPLLDGNTQRSWHSLFIFTVKTWQPQHLTEEFL